MSDLLQISDELLSLGVTVNYKGCKQAALAVSLALEDENRLYCVTKEIYWKVADMLGCDRYDVERNIRTVSRRAWKVCRPELQTMARYPLPVPPSASEFIAILTAHIRRTQIVSNM